jgi:hypothetical protein
MCMYLFNVKWKFESLSFVKSGTKPGTESEENQEICTFNYLLPTLQSQKGKTHKLTAVSSVTEMKDITLATVNVQHYHYVL